jgi:hypothetical protein
MCGFARGDSARDTSRAGSDVPRRREFLPGGFVRAHPESKEIAADLSPTTSPLAARSLKGSSEGRPSAGCFDSDPASSRQEEEQRRVPLGDCLRVDKRLNDGAVAPRVCSPTAGPIFTGDATAIVSGQE